MAKAVLFTPYPVQKSKDEVIVIKSYAAFIKNTVEPLIDKLGDIVAYAESKNIPITKESISDLLEGAFLAHLVTWGLQAILYIVLTSIICYTVFLCLTVPL